MGYREDVAVAYTAEGWNQLLSEINSWEEPFCEDAINLIQEADQHYVSDDGCHFLLFDCVKTYADDMKPYIAAHTEGNIDATHFLMMCLGEDGNEDCHGDFWGNPFDIGVTRSLSFDTGSAMPYKNSIVKNDIPTIPTIPAPPKEVVNDHTCASCGNNRCSKSEKTCWKCGSPL